MPIVCAACGHSAVLSAHSAPLDRALVYSTFLRELRHELGLLERTERFFARFPASKHRLKISKTHCDRKDLGEIQDDPEFEKELRAEPELYAFLTEPSSFLLPARLRGVKKCIHHLQADLDISLVVCPACKTGQLTIEEEFFQRL